ncbi:MAG TPA: hypothetical protein VKW08_13875 [Xanthobacteraceae bacterium]|jgi:hypothetical protein|nr:hypothetical protein [Xanthobacteraceae bacterium]
MNAPPPNQNPDRVARPEVPGNPSDAYPPSRPGPIIIAIALALIVVGFSIENWSDVSALARSAGL